MQSTYNKFVVRWIIGIRLRGITDTGNGVKRSFVQRAAGSHDVKEEDEAES